MSHKFSKWLANISYTVILTSSDIQAVGFSAAGGSFFGGSSIPPTTIIGSRSNHNHIIGKMVVPLGWYPSCLTPRSPLKGDIPTKYPLYKVYMELIMKGPPSQGHVTIASKRNRYFSKSPHLVPGIWWSVFQNQPTGKKNMAICLC